MPGGGAQQVQRVERAFGVGRERFLHG
jgi:hypothetical protein